MEGPPLTEPPRREPSGARRFVSRRAITVLVIAALIVAVLGTYLYVSSLPPVPSGPTTPPCDTYTFKPSETVCIRVLSNASTDLSFDHVATTVNETYNLSLLWVTWRAGHDTAPPGYNGTMHFLIAYRNGSTLDCGNVCFDFGFGNAPFGFRQGDSVTEEIAFFTFLADERTRPAGEPYNPSNVVSVRLYFTREDTQAVISDTVEVILTDVTG